MPRTYTPVLTEPEYKRLLACAEIDYEAHDDPNHPDAAAIDGMLKALRAAATGPDLLQTLRKVREAIADARQMIDIAADGTT